MYEYPPWHPDWNWRHFGTLFCPLIVPAIALLVAAIVIVRSTTGARRFKLLGVASAIAVCWPFLPWPPIGNARDAAERTACRNNLKQIAAAVHQHHDQHGRLPSPAASEADGPPVSWRIDVLQFISPEDGPAHGIRYDPGIVAGYDRSRPWDDALNLPTALRRPPLYTCPANRAPRDAQQRWYTAYAFLTGPGTAFPADGPLTLDQITDGTSNTLLVVEACGRNIVWTEPRDVDVSRETLQINAPGSEPGTSAGIASSYHQGGALMALADGRVRLISDTISPDVLQKLSTAVGGETMGQDEF